MVEEKKPKSKWRTIASDALFRTGVVVGGLTSTAAALKVANAYRPEKPTPANVQPMDDVVGDVPQGRVVNFQGGKNQKNVTQILGELKTTDQYGQPFEANKTLKGKPYLIVQGFLHCETQCPRIRGNLGNIRSALEEKAKGLESENKPKEAKLLREIPIVWVDTFPTAADYGGRQKGDKEEPEACVIEAYKKGLWQNPAHAENFPTDMAGRERLAKEAFAQGKPEDGKETPKSVLHVVFPENGTRAMEFQKRIGASFDPNNAKSHNARITLVGADGVGITHVSGLETDSKRQKLLTDTVINAALDAVRGMGR